MTGDADADTGIIAAVYMQLVVNAALRRQPTLMGWRLQKYGDPYCATWSLLFWSSILVNRSS